MDAHVCRYASTGNGSLCRPLSCGPFVRIGLYGAWVVCPYLGRQSRASYRKDIQPHAFFCAVKCQNKRNSHELALVLDMESRQFQLKRIRGYSEIRTHARPVLAWAYCMPRASCILFL